jgi:hypothetical protein
MPDPLVQLGRKASSTATNRRARIPPPILVNERWKRAGKGDKEEESVNKRRSERAKVKNGRIK